MSDSDTPNRLRKVIASFRKKKASLDRAREDDDPEIATISAPRLPGGASSGVDDDDEDGVRAIEAPSVGGDREAALLAAVESSAPKKYVAYDGPFFSYTPRNREMDDTCRSTNLKVVIEFPKALEKLAKKDAESYPLQRMHDKAAEAVREVAGEYERELAELDQLLDDLYAGRVQMDAWDLVGRAVEVQNHAIEAATAAEAAAAAAALAVLETRKGNRWAKIKYRVKAFFKIGAATTSAGTAVVRAVGSGGADVTAYVQAAKAVVKIAQVVRALLQTADDVWVKVEAGLDELQEAIDTPALEIPATFAELKAHPVVKAAKGSLRKVAKGLTEYDAKIGGQQDKVDKLVRAMNEFLAAATELHHRVSADPPSADAVQLVAESEAVAREAVDIAFSAGADLTRHLDQQADARQIVLDYKAAQGSTEAWVNGIKSAGKVTFKLVRKADEIGAKVSQIAEAVNTVTSVL